MVSRFRPARRTYKPNIEVLEDRWLPTQTFTVLNNRDSGTGSLRAAIAAANSGDTITFSSSGLSDTAGTGNAQTIKLTGGSLVPTVNVTITDAGAPAVLIASTSSRIFDFPLSSPGTLTAVTLQDLTLNGTANDGTTGGAIHISTISAFVLTIDSCTITGSLAGAGAATRGGAISVTGLNDSLTVTNCVIRGTVTTTNTVSNNDAGALYVATTQTVSVKNSTLSGSVTGSTTSNEGGALYQNSGTLNLTNCTFSGSSAGKGGGFYQQGGTATLTDCTISGNTATGNGGGVYLGKGTLNLVNSTIAGNTAGSKGGGVIALFHSSNGTGGTSVTNLTNCTISGNTAATALGLYLGYTKPTTGINPTGSNKVTVNNTIIAGSVVRQTSGNATNSNTILNASHSLFDTTLTTGSGNTLNGTNTSNLFGMDPMLSSLGNNGGSTQTLALSSNSPAIDAGSNTLASALTTDQRGDNRFVNGVVDIGAYEYQPAATVALTSSANPSTVGDTVTFTATLSVVTGSNTPSGSVTFTIDGAFAGTVSLNGLSASLTATSLTAGSHTVSATYNEAIPFPSGLVSSSLKQTVEAATPASTPVILPAYFAVGADAGGGPQVNIYNAVSGTGAGSIDGILASFTGGVRVAVGDVTGDGIPDIVCAAGPGGSPQVNVFDGKNFQLIRTFFAFSTGFTGGVFVAIGAVTGSGQADIICSADAGGGPQVAVFDGKDDTLLESFYAFSSTFSGGVRVAVGDVNGDGQADIICTAGAGGGPQVEIFDGATLNVLASYYAFASTFSGGVYVAAGDVNGDGRADVICGAGTGGGPQVVVFDGRTQAMLDSFFALDSSFTGGVRVGFSKTAAGRSAILAGAGPGGGPQVNVFDSSSLTLLDHFYALDASFTGGVFVG